MAESFSSRITQLRKYRHISQKEAAQALGISQALLSHYENGIRECGIDFIVRAAEFYGVTCDYLLGRSNSKYGFSDDYNFDDPLENDKYLSILTIYRAAAALRETMGDKSDEFMQNTLTLYALCVYRVLVYGVSTGRVPGEWINVETLAELDTYLNTVDALMVRMLDYTTPTKTSLKASDEEIPDCLQTIIRTAHTTFAGKVASIEKIIAERRIPED